MTRLADVGAVLFPKPYPTTVSGKVERFYAAEGFLREAVADLTVVPPADARTDNAAMLSEFRILIALYKRVIADVEAGNGTAAQQASSAVVHSPSNVAFGRAVKDLEAKGYLPKVRRKS